MKKFKIVPAILAVCLIASGCANTGTADTAAETQTEITETETAEEAETAADESNNGNNIDNSNNESDDILSELFSDRDMRTDYDESECVKITLTGDGASCDSDGVIIEGSTVRITSEGYYILSGTLDDGMIIIDADKSDKVQLILDGADITSRTSAAIYAASADKVFITTAEGSYNVLTNGGEYAAIDDSNIDSVIFSKDDLTLNGTGTLTVNAAAGHGIVSKDDLKLTSGTYIITSEKHGLSANDSIRIAGGNYMITSGKDAVNCDDYVTIVDGIFEISADDDAIHADTSLTIYGGDIDIEKCYEGLEGLSIDIYNGNIKLTSDDDGINASDGSDTGSSRNTMFAPTEGAYIRISGGAVYVNASGDGLDSNGDLYITGGEVYVSGSTLNMDAAVDFDGTGIIEGGTIIAAGSSGMAQNFGSDSTQGSILVSVGRQEEGTAVTLKDSDGNEIISWQPDKTYSSVLISTPDIVDGAVYTLTAGTYSEDITMDGLIYGSGFGGMGGFGGGIGRSAGDMENFGSMTAEDILERIESSGIEIPDELREMLENGEMPDMGEMPGMGGMPGRDFGGEMPEDLRERMENGEMPDMGGITGRGQRPGGDFDGEIPDDMRERMENGEVQFGGRMLQDGRNFAGAGRSDADGG